MATVKPFVCVRPDAAAVSKVAALPYDVYSRKEACDEVKGKTLSFLNIDRAETHALISEKTKDDILHIIQEHFEVDIEKIEKEVSDMLEMLCQENIIYGYKSVC